MCSDVSLLQVSGLHAHYGELEALKGIGFHINKGEVVTLLGRNGAGKTTTLRCLMGMQSKRSGSVLFNGHQTINTASNKVAQLGMAYCPEERGVFPTLTVEENLLLPPVVRDGGVKLDEIFTLFPNLKERRRVLGGYLSGGEQQMLAIARILRTGAELLLLDEPSEGLAPTIVAEIAAAITDLKSRGFSILLVEQNFHFACDMADRFYIMEEGEIIEEIGIEEVKTKEKMIMEKLTL